MHKLYREQQLPITVDEAWEFFSNPGNLADITPKYLGFEILTDLSDDVTRMYQGMIIAYRIRPLPGIPIRWVTEITHVQKPNHFVDEQRFGPYAFWHHQHNFETVVGGTLMRDIVHYRVRGGVFGRLVNRLFIRRRLDEIFDYRSRMLEQLFNEPTPPAVA